MRLYMQVSAPPPRFHKGFTLLELLVVIGIIAVLIAVLLPALAGARRAAYSLKCVDNLREIAMAGRLHAAAHRGYYPLAGNLVVGSAYPEGLDDPNRQRYTYYEPPATPRYLASFPGAVAAMIGKRGGLDAYTFQAQVASENDPDGFLRLFYCPLHITRPEDAIYALTYNTPNSAWYLRQSYVLNEGLLGWNDALGRRRGFADHISRHSEVFLAADGLPGSSSRLTRGYPWATVYNKTSHGPISLGDALLGNARAGDPQNFDLKRHRGRINICFLDGHAASFPLSPAGLGQILILP